MMTNEEFDAIWLDDLRERAADTVNLLANERKPERERRTCAAFLRCAGIPFSIDNVQASEEQPPDVCFESARFEITQSTDHKMHREWKERDRRRTEASQVKELLEPYHPPEVLSREQVVRLVAERSAEKARRYIERGISCAKLDLLVYVNRNALMNADTPTAPADVLLSRGWRSVSALIPPHSYVMLATNGAPDFLLELAEKPMAAWPNGCFGLFEL